MPPALSPSRWESQVSVEGGREPWSPSPESSRPNGAARPATPQVRNPSEYAGAWLAVVPPQCARTDSVLAAPSPWSVRIVDYPHRRARAILKHLHDQIGWLAGEIDEDERVPSQLALQTCEYILSGVANLVVGGRLALPHIGTAGDGDLYCDWRRHGRVVSILVDESGSAVLRQREVQDANIVVHRVVKAPSIEAVMQGLVWIGVLEVKP